MYAFRSVFHSVFLYGHVMSFGSSVVRSFFMYICRFVFSCFAMTIASVVRSVVLFHDVRSLFRYGVRSVLFYVVVR